MGFLRAFFSFSVLGASLFLPLSLHAETVTKDGTPRYVETNLIPEFQSARAGQSLSFAVTQTHAEGWHTYWKNPGDSGDPTKIEWTLPKGVTAGGIIYPAPERQATGPLMNFGYHGTSVLLTSIDIPKDYRADTLPVTAKISWLACMDICVPEIKTVTLAVPVTRNGDEPTATDPRLFAEARAALPQDKAWQGTLEEQDQVLILNFAVGDDDKKALEGAKDFFFFPEEWGILLNATPQDISAVNGKLTVKAQRDSRPLSEIETLNGVLTYQDAEGAKHSAAVSVPVISAALTPAPTLSRSGEGGETATENTSFIQAIVLALLGGIILNLMPCVFPVLSMKALSLIKMSDREQKHANLHGIFYTLGVLTCFGAIAGTLIALQNAGQHIGWGFQLQNPVVVLLLAYLLFAMALNLSGFFEIKSGLLANIGHKLTLHHGYKGTFFTGMLATIVATPCTAPFMATAMGYALTQPAAVALSVFMALGLGLALPYLALCFIPPLRKSLPKPGAWMETFRQLMAFPLFASVAWLIWIYAQQAVGDYTTLLGLSGLLLIAFSVWVSKHEPRRQPLKTAVHALSVSAVILALMIVGLTQIRMMNQNNCDTVYNADSDMPSVAYTKPILDSLLQGDDPIFVDMTAAWCITCKVNERVAIYTDETETLFKEKNIRFVVGDWTNRNPEITDFLTSYGRNGVPLYVFYGARNPATGERPEPRILPQLLTSGLIADVINGDE